MPIAGPADPGHGQGDQIREDCSRGGVHPFSFIHCYVGIYFLFRALIRHREDHVLHIRAQLQDS